MINFPQLDSFNINFPDGYLGGQEWIQRIHNILHGIVEADEYALMPSLVEDILYIDYARARFNRMIDTDTGDTNYVKRSKLTITSDNVDILAGDMDIDVVVDTDLDYQELVFIDSKIPLFKIEDLNREQEIVIGFKVLSVDSYGRSFFNSAYFKFFYKTSTRFGDVNGDGVIDLRGLVSLSDHVMGDKNAKYPDAGDISKDGNTNIYDIVVLANSILSGY